MDRIIDILQSEYSSEYFLKKYTKPKIYPKVVTSKPLSAFSEKEKSEIMSKYKRWYVYYSFINPNIEPFKMKRQDPVYFNVNREHPDFNDRLKHIKMIRKSVESILKNGYSPYAGEKNPAMFKTESALDFALNIKKNTLKVSSFTDYENRLSHFKTYLKKKSLLNSSIKSIDKRVVNSFLNEILENSSSRNRNNSKTVLSALFTVLEDNDIIERNFIKNIKALKTKPKKNKAFTELEVKQILSHLKEVDVWLYYYCSHVYYGLFRPIEIVRIKIENIKLDSRLIESDTKTGDYFKQIPNFIFDEFYSKIDLTKYKESDYLFTRFKEPGEWGIKEASRREFFGEHFNKKVKKKFGFSNDYTVYSFRHSAVGKLFIEKIKQLKDAGEPNFEERSLDFVRSITLHKDNKTVRQYLREIGYFKIDDWSEFL